MNNEFMSEIKYIVGGTPCALYGDDYFYAIFNGNWYKLGKRCFNGDNEECCLVTYPTTTDDGHHGFIKVERYREGLHDRAKIYGETQSNRPDYQICHQLGYASGAIEQVEIDTKKVVDWIVDNFCNESKKALIKTDDVDDEGIPVEWRFVDSDELYDKIQELLMV